MIGNMFELQNLIKHIVVVEGNRVTFNFADVDIKDNILTINKNTAYNTTTGTTGLEFDRLTEDQVKIMWDEAVSAFKIQKGANLTDMHFIHDQGGWNDLIGQIFVPPKGKPGDHPLWIDIGNGTFGWSFSDDLTNYIYVDYHIKHDIKVGSDIYPHIHWLPMGYDTGNVCWKVDWVQAKGHQQGESLAAATSTCIISGTANGIIGEHMISECSDLEAFAVNEVDSVVRVRISRDVDNVLDTYYGNVVLLLADLHYQADRQHTPEKSPNFYLGEV